MSQAGRMAVVADCRTWVRRDWRGLGHRDECLATNTVVRSAGTPHELKLPLVYDCVPRTVHYWIKHYLRGKGGKGIQLMMGNWMNPMRITNLAWRNPVGYATCIAAEAGSYCHSAFG